MCLSLAGSQTRTLDKLRLKERVLKEKMIVVMGDTTMSQLVEY